jgi:hypothetical protein
MRYAVSLAAAVLLAAALPGVVTAGPQAGESSTAAETYEDISREALQGPPTLPVPTEDGGPSVLRLQILLDRARFSPGVMDGYWGSNTERAVRFFQQARGMEATGKADRATWEALRSDPGQDRPFLQQHTVSQDDLKGPFVKIPESPYEKKDLECLCYESPAEMLAERSHTTRELLKKLNPDVDLDNLQAGTALWLPDVPELLPREPWRPTSDKAKASKEEAPKEGAPKDAEASSEGPGQGEQAKGRRNAPPMPDEEGRARPGSGSPVKKIVISRSGFYLHALDEQGKVLFHLPSTLGSEYDPSPEGDFKVTGIHRNPEFHYQPKLFADVSDAEPNALLPPGQNSPVGVVWMQLSKENYGIHGTAEPETIGHTSSHGCVRLTNWDAWFLADQIEPGVPVEFVE